MNVKIEDLKVGMHVQTREDLQDYDLYGTQTWCEEMKKGIVEITHIDIDRREFEVLGCDWTYSIEMAHCIIEPKNESSELLQAIQELTKQQKETNGWLRDINDILLTRM